jgi:hypothetical protein
MNVKTEEKLLRAYSKLLDAPEQAEKRFMRYGKIAMFICILIILLLLSDNTDPIENKFFFALFAFISGAAFGLCWWFLQAGTQTVVILEHMSRDSIDKRLEEIAHDTGTWPN